MSVPVRYSAAAKYAVVDESSLPATSGLEQEHLQQQQLFKTLLSNHNNSNSCTTNGNCYNNLEQQHQQQQQQQQQQLMQHQWPMSSQTEGVTSTSVATTPTPSPLNVDLKPSTSAMAAAAAAATAVSNSGDKAEWMWMSDEGRYGIPGAAGLEYQKHELAQQTTTANNNGDVPMEPSLTDNENTMKIMNNGSMQTLEDLHTLSSDVLFNTLREYDALQDKYHTVLLMPKESRREVTAGGRDGSAYVLRCLKMWYELPSDVLFSAMSLVDRFLDRMAVKPKHMACLSVASFNLAIKQLELKPIPAEDLVTISQCGCTAGDLERMTNVIANKLGVQMGHAPITSVCFLRIYYALFRNLAQEIGGPFFEFYQQYIILQEMENRLENLLCDVKTTVISPSTLALVLISLHLDFHIKASYPKGRPELKVVFEYILFLQQFLRVPDRVFTCGFSIVSGILSHYNGQNKQPYKQRLVWKLSSRTLRVLRPTNRYRSDLPTIDEGISQPMDDGCRSRTESISSEEEEDWPTSPIIPIFEQC